MAHLHPALDTLRARLSHVRESGSGFTARCPAHEDHENSLSVGAGDNGNVVLNCFAGCETEAVLSALHLTILDIAPPLAERKTPKFGRGRREGVRVSALAAVKHLPEEFLAECGLAQDGEVVKVAYRTGDGKPCRQRRRAGLSGNRDSSWYEGDAPIVPYGLWRKRAETVFLVEGESDCWTLWFHGQDAIGLPGATMQGKLQPEHVVGIPRLVIVRETDRAGAEFARRTGERLESFEAAERAYVLSMPEGVKDPSALHVRDPQGFIRAWQALQAGCVPLPAYLAELRRTDADRKRKELDALLARVKADPGVALEADAVAAWAVIRRGDRAAWTRAKLALKKAGVSIRDVEAAVREHLRPVDEDHAAPRRAKAMLAECPCPELIVPEPYFLRGDATGHVVTDDDGKPTWRTFAHAPILITGRLRDQEEQVESLRLSWRRQASWLDATVDRGTALNGQKLVELASSGFPVAGDNARDVARYLHRLEAANYPSLPAARVSAHLGWQGADGAAGFLVGRTLVLPDGSDSGTVNVDDLAPEDWREDWISFRGVAGGDEQIADGFRTEGTFDGWRAAVARIAPYPRVALALYAALAPPLLEIIHCSNFVVDWACRTSTGKTTALRVAASVWGNPDEKAANAALGTWDATKVWIERASTVLTGLPVILDDTKKAKEKSLVADFIYSVASGRGRGRGNVRSLSRTGTWRTVLLSSGESPATSYTQDGGTRARCMEVRGTPFGKDDRPTRELVDALNIGITTHYGHAGLEFVKRLLREREAWPDFRQAWQDSILEYASSTDSAAAGRMAHYAAAIDLAAALAHAWLDLPWAYADPLATLWADIVAEAADAAGEIRALRDVASWAYSHAGSFFGRESTMQDPDRDPPGGWLGKWEPGDEWEYIAFYPHLLTDFLESRSYTAEAIFVEWQERDWLQETSCGQRYCCQLSVGGGKKPRLIAIKKKAFEEAGA